MVAAGFWVWLFLAVLGVGLTVWMVARVLRRRSQVRAVWIGALLVNGAAVAYAVFGAILGLVRAYEAIGGESVDPTERARIVAEGISEVINCTAFALLVWVPSLVVAFVLTRPKKPRSEKAEG